MKGNKFTWHLVSGILWAEWGQIPFGDGKRVHDKFMRDVVDYLCFLQDDGVIVDTAGGSVSLPVLAHVSWAKAIFIDEDSNYAYYVLETQAPDAFESVYFSIPIRTKKEGSYKIELFKSPTLSDRIAQVQQVIKIFTEAKSFADALVQAENAFDIIAAIGTKGHSIFTEIVNLANLEKANRDTINIKICKSFLEAKLSSPANLLIIDPTGRKIGFDPDVGKPVYEIPNATYTGPGTKPQIIIIYYPLPGGYKIKVIGIDSGSYLLNVTYCGENKTTNELSFSSTIQMGAIEEYDIQLSASGEINLLQPTPLNVYVIIIVLIATSLIVTCFVYIKYRRKRY
ncbi:MAG: hypothetical protein QW778_05530 [Candidatus Micrarchaeaceae archaeon]